MLGSIDGVLHTHAPNLNLDFDFYLDPAGAWEERG
jgi:hypothetical protein